MHPSFPAAFPGACELLEPLAPPAQCLSFRKEVTHWEYVQCIFLQERGNLLQSVSQRVCGCVSVIVSASQVAIPRLPPHPVVSNCPFSQALATHNALLVPSWVFNRALTFLSVAAGLQGGTVIFCIRVR